MATFIHVVSSLVGKLDSVPVCKHPVCKQEAVIQIQNRDKYCSEWCHKNSIVLQYSRNQQCLTHEEYCCQAGCGRHRGIKSDRTMFKYCSPECHRIATHNNEQCFQSNYQSPNSHHQQVFQPAQQQSHEIFWHKRREYHRDPILFYNRDQPFYEFTNFYMCRILIDNSVWPSTEYYFQAQKFVFTPYYYHICRDAQTPHHAFEISRRPDISRWKRTDWEEVKIQIMLKALLAKFLQHDDLRVMLVTTGSKVLVENSPSDHYWGIGSDGRGENHLGKLLMHVREICSGKHVKHFDNVTYDLVDLPKTQTLVDTVDIEQQISSVNAQKPCKAIGYEDLIDLTSDPLEEDCQNPKTNLVGMVINNEISKNSQITPMETDNSIDEAGNL